MASDGWWNDVFVDGADAYAEVLEAHVPEAEAEVDFLAAQLRAQGIEPGSLILDLGCGIGRHAIEFADRGYRVTGLDLSERFVEIARRRAEAAGVDSETNFVEGDMRSASRMFAADQFDAVVSLFSSFGFFDEETNQGVLEEAAAVTTSEAVFIIDTINRDWLMRNFQATGLMVDGDVMTIERRSFDFDKGRSHSKWTVLRPSGEDTLERAISAEVDLRVYCLHELDALFNAANWSRRAVYGNLEGSDFGVGSRRIVGLYGRSASAGDE